MDDFSIPFQVDRLGPNPKKIHIRPTDAERELLRARFELLSLDQLDGHAILKRLSGKMIEVVFDVTIKLVQSCVVTDKPVPATLNLAFRRVYDGAYSTVNDKKEVEIDIESSEELDPIIDGVIDLGAAVSEELGLEIEPFPRADKTGFAEFGFGPEITEEEEKSSNPFSVLAGLKNKSD